MGCMSDTRGDHSDAVRAAHALRDREESDRLRQLGGLLVHDLNNVLFALLGRIQLLERRAEGDAHVRPDEPLAQRLRRVFDIDLSRCASLAARRSSSCATRVTASFAFA